MNYHLSELRRAIDFSKRSQILRSQAKNLATHIEMLKIRSQYLKDRGNMTPDEKEELDLGFQYAEAEKARLEQEVINLTREMLSHLP